MHYSHLAYVQFKRKEMAQNIKNQEEKFTKKFLHEVMTSHRIEYRGFKKKIPVAIQCKLREIQS